MLGEYLKDAPKCEMGKRAGLTLVSMANEGRVTEGGGQGEIAFECSREGKPSVGTYVNRDSVCLRYGYGETQRGNFYMGIEELQRLIYVSELAVMYLRKRKRENG